MTVWPTIGTGLLEKAVQTLQAPREKGPRAVTGRDPDQATGAPRRRAAAAPPADLRGAIVAACHTDDLDVACRQVQDILGIDGDGLAPLHFDYLRDKDAPGPGWRDLDPPARHRLLLGYAVSEIMSFGAGLFPSMGDDEIEGPFMAPPPAPAREPRPANALEAFRRTAEVMTVAEFRSRTRTNDIDLPAGTVLRIYAGQWWLAEGDNGTWRLDLGDDPDPDSATLEDLEERLFHHAVTAKITA